MNNTVFKAIFNFACPHIYTRYCFFRSIKFTDCLVLFLCLSSWNYKSEISRWWDGLLQFIYLHKDPFRWPLITVLLYESLRSHVNLLVKKGTDRPNLCLSNSKEKLIKLLGSLSNDESNGDGKVKTAKGLSQTTSLRVHFLTVTARLPRKKGLI